MTSLNDDRDAVLAWTARVEWDRLVETVIEQMRSLDKNAMQSGDDSPLQSVWEEYCVQVQGQEGVLFELYEDQLAEVCAYAIQSLPDPVRVLLWVESGLIWQTPEFQEEDGVPPLGEPIDSSLERELLDRVQSAAMDEDIPTLNQRLWPLLPWSASAHLTWLGARGFDFQTFFADPSDFLRLDDSDLIEFSKEQVPDLLHDMELLGYVDTTFEARADLMTHMQEDLKRVVIEWKRLASPLLT